MKKILNLALKNNINTIETAESYGSSENKLGKLKTDKFNILTKLPINEPKKNIDKWVERSIKNSIRKLNVKNLYGIFVHNTNQLRGSSGKEIYKNLLKAKQKKLVKKIGVSVYSTKELKSLLSKFNFDIVSIPFSIFDQRIKRNGWLNRLKKKNIDVYARSIFLQGLLLMEHKSRPKIFRKWRKLFDKFDHIIKKNNKTRLEVCLNFVLNNPKIDKVILGFDDISQFSDLTKAVKVSKNLYGDNIFSNDKNLLNPTYWKSL